MPYIFVDIFLTAVIYLTPLIVFLPFKLTIRKKALLFTLIIANILFMAFVSGNIGVILLLMTVSLYIYFIDTHHLRNICLFLASYIINVVWNNLTGMIAWLLFHITNEQIRTTPSISIVFAILDILSIYAISKLLVFLFQKVNTHLRLDTIPPKVLFPIVINLMLTLILFVVNIVEGEQIGYPPAVVNFNTFVFVAYFLISTWTIIRSIRTYQREADMQMKQTASDAMQKYTKQVEDLYNNLRSFKHDYANILMTMHSFIDDGDMPSLSDYFHREILPLSDQLSPQNAHITKLANLKIEALKSLVTAKLIYAQEMHIDTTIEIDTPVEKIDVDIIDLTRMMGIFLDNAIEAALETATPFLHFAVITNQDEIVFTIANSFIDHHLDIKNLASPDSSSKGTNHGIGLYNVSKILAEYPNLYLDTQTDEHTFMQILHIMPT